MTITNGYATLIEFKARYYAGSDATADDTTVEAVIEAVSREIDNVCSRRFWKNTNDETRYYNGEWDDLLLCADDIVSITTLATDGDGDRVYETTWAETDYDLEPFNAALDGKPYTFLRVSPNGNYSFPTMRKGIKIVGKFGWPSVPDAIAEACLLQSGRLFKRKDALFGVVGSAEMGQVMVIPALDPDVKLLIQPYKRGMTGAA